MFTTRFDVAGNVALRFLESYLVAVRYLVRNPVSEVFGRRIKVKHFVEVPVVHFVCQHFLDVAEVNNHSVFVKLFGTAVDGNDTVVAVQALAFAFVV